MSRSQIFHETQLSAAPAALHNTYNHAHRCDHRAIMEFSGGKSPPAQPPPPLRKIVKHRPTVISHRSHGNLNPALISSVLVFYLVFNQSITTSILSSRSYLPNFGLIQVAESTKTRGSLIGLATASPAPEPAAVKTRSATTQRGPPINGSIFGKRSTDNAGQHRSKSYPNSDRSVDEYDMVTRKYQTSDPAHYQDIITDLIENFMALNNKNNPHETTVAFCRMIVSECSELLSANKRRNLEKRARVNRT